MSACNVEPGEAAPSVRSSELLGFPPDARVLVINNDDFGMYDAINTAVIDSIENGIASSYSLMVPCPSAPHAMRLLRDRPEIPFGIHLTLVCDLPDHPWELRTAKDRTLSLLDHAGELFTPARITEFLAQARLDEVEAEFRAQIDTVDDAGLAPTHLDWHCLADGGRDDIFDLTVALAGEYGLAVRAWLEPGRRKTRRRHLPVTDDEFLDSFSLDVEGTQYRLRVPEMAGSPRAPPAEGIVVIDDRSVQHRLYRGRHIRVRPGERHGCCRLR